MEFVESFLIFFYGSTNIFLEHLAGNGGAWTAKDLQHVSIAFMFIGTGLCGLLTEYKLNHWRFEHARKRPQTDVVAATPGYSPNPFPAFTIFWTGILMSQHAQSSQFSTTIHTQWGYLLSYGSFFRLLTFLILFLVPNTNSAASKPFTELITSFCLLCGGLVFMESTDQSIEAMEYRGLPHVHFQPQCWIRFFVDGLGNDFIYLERLAHQNQENQSLTAIMAFLFLFFTPLIFE